MNITTIKSGVSLFIKKAQFFVRRNTPTLLTAGGIMATGAAIVTSSFAGVKAKDIIIDTKNNLEDIKKSIYNDEKTRNKDKLKVYMNATCRILKVYAPTLLLYSLSAGSMLSSTNIMKKRNAALAASYAAIQSQYLAYRDRVKAAIGEEAEAKVFDDIKKKKVKKIDENGNEIEEEIEEYGLEQDDYIYMFDETMPGWTKNTRYNLDTLIMYEDRLTSQLIRQGFLFMEDVWKLLGVERTQLSKTQLQEARVVGWIYDRDIPNGDNRVSFGLRNADGSLTQRAKDMLRRGDPGVLLVFNPDGDIVTGNIDKSTGIAKRIYGETARF